MSYLSQYPQYVPPDSFAIQFDGSVFWIKDVASELKARFEKDLAQLRKEADERHKQGIYSSADVY